MAFTLRRPLAIANALKNFPKASSITARSFQTQSALLSKQSFKASQPATTPLKRFAQQQSFFLNAFRQSSRRSYQTSTPSLPGAQGNLTHRLICKLPSIHLSSTS